MQMCTPLVEKQTNPKVYVGHRIVNSTTSDVTDEKVDKYMKFFEKHRDLLDVLKNR